MEANLTRGEIMGKDAHLEMQKSVTEVLESWRDELVNAIPECELYFIVKLRSAGAESIGLTQYGTPNGQIEAAAFLLKRVQQFFASGAGVL